MIIGYIFGISITLIAFCFIVIRPLIRLFFAGVDKAGETKTGKKVLKKVSIVGWVVFGILGVFALFFLLSVGFLLKADHDDSEKHAKCEKCYRIIKGGEPSFLMIDGTKYSLKSDSTMDDIDQVFLNPWHREIITNEGCIDISAQEFDSQGICQ